MKYGKYTSLVEEIIDYVKYGELFIPNSSIIEDVHLINNLEQAKVYAWDETYGNDELIWSDIREKEMSIVKKTSYEIESFDAIRDNLTKILKLFIMYVRKRLDDQYKDLLDDIVGDLYNCAFNRSINGKKNNFYERIYQIYNAGGWACGWKGEYPNGKLVGFFPEKKGIASAVDPLILS